MRSSFAPIHGYVATYIRKVNNFRRSFPDCEISSAICLAKTQKFRIIIDNCKGQFYWITKAKGVLKFSSPLKNNVPMAFSRSLRQRIPERLGREKL